MKLASIFTDHMVLQAQKPVKVFGEGKGTIEVEFLGEKKGATFTDDSWCIELSPRPYGGPYEMNIILDGETTILKDIYVGEVWLAAGQSNMELMLVLTDNAFDEAKHSYNEKIRFFGVPKRFKKDRPSVSGTHFKETGEDTPWKICDENTTITFSAMGYYVAKELQQKLGVAIGIISCNWGGTKIETHICRDYFADCKALIPALEEYNQMLSELDMDEYNKAFDKYQEEYENYYDKLEDFNLIEWIRERGVHSVASVQLGVSVPACPKGPYNPSMAGCLYDSMLARVIPYSLRGVLWYQGESNGDDFDYIHKYLTYMKCVRDKFEDENLPFYAVELASFSRWWSPGYQQTDDRFVTNESWAFLREQQYEATRRDKNNYVVTSMELGDKNEIHPIHKKPLAHRMALKVLKYTYGFDITADQPMFRSVEFKDSKAYLTFDNANGLYAKHPTIVKMYLADESKVLKRADIEINDGKVVLSSDEVKNPILVRYGFDNYYDGAHIYNASGLPLAPFRTDTDV